MFVWIASVLAALLLGTILFWRVIFLRNPARIIPEGNNIVSPADGKIISILRFSGNEAQLYKGNKRFLGLINTLTKDVASSGYVVSIFMSPLDVHYNRAPITGQVHSVVHTSGRFLPVNTLEAGLVNEKTETIIHGDTVTVKMIQIAGFLAKRVVTYVEPGANVAKGEVVGVINLGSQVTLVLPDTITLSVTNGMRVTAGETIIAKANT